MDNLLLVPTVFYASCCETMLSIAELVGEAKYSRSCNDFFLLSSCSACVSDAVDTDQEPHLDTALFTLSPSCFPMSLNQV